jgi:hypothetical protein
MCPLPCTSQPRAPKSRAVAEPSRFGRVRFPTQRQEEGEEQEGEDDDSEDESPSGSEEGEEEQGVCARAPVNHGRVR